MNSKNGRVNHDFQILYFLVGSCHTADGAYSLLCELKDERESVVKNLHVNELRGKAKILKLKKQLQSEDESERLEAEADLEEIENNKDNSDKLILAAKKELEFINKCIDRIQPYRVFSNLPEHEAHEACQYEEWKLELINRAENFLLTGGGIPSDHFNAMRMHPAFTTEILPAIENVKYLMQEGKFNSLFLPKQETPKGILHKYLLEIQDNKLLE